jgi:hypothetical protein
MTDREMQRLSEQLLKLQNESRQRSGDELGRRLMDILGDLTTKDLGQLAVYCHGKGIGHFLGTGDMEMYDAN